METLKTMKTVRTIHLTLSILSFILGWYYFSTSVIAALMSWVLTLYTLARSEEYNRRIKSLEDRKR